MLLVNNLKDSTAKKGEITEVSLYSQSRLRLSTARNNQQKGMKWAKDYEI